MKIKIWGTRGSIPSTDPEMGKYGGNTSCVQVWQDGWQLVLDGGSGIQRLASNIHLDTKRIDILLTHLHIDHIQGLGFFRPLFDETMEVHIWGTGQQYPYFTFPLKPVPLATFISHAYS